MEKPTLHVNELWGQQTGHLWHPYHLPNLERQSSSSYPVKANEHYGHTWSHDPHMKSHDPHTITWSTHMVTWSTYMVTWSPSITELSSIVGSNKTCTHIFLGLCNGFAHCGWCPVQLLRLELGLFSGLDLLSVWKWRSQCYISLPVRSENSLFELHVAHTFNRLNISFLGDLSLG